MCAYFLSSNSQEPSQQLAPSVASAQSMPERPESPASARPGVAGLTTAAAFKPLGPTSIIKSPSWQRQHQTGTPASYENVFSGVREISLVKLILIQLRSQKGCRGGRSCFPLWSVSEPFSLCVWCSCHLLFIFIELGISFFPRLLREHVLNCKFGVWLIHYIIGRLSLKI